MDLSPYVSFLAGHPWLALAVSRVALVLVMLVVVRVVVGLMGAVRDRAVSRLSKELATTHDDQDAERVLHLQTVFNVLFDVLRIVAYSFVVLTALSQFGVSVQPIVAGAGLIGAGVALGSQTIVKDFVSGLFILAENHFSIGDQIAVGDKLTGVVERMTLRVTVLRDLDGTAHIIPNGSITTVTNRTYHWAGAHLSVSTPAAAGVGPVREALQRAAEATRAREGAKDLLSGDVIVTGPSNIKGTSIEWSLSVRTPSTASARVKSWLIEDVVRELASASVPLS